MNEGPFDRRGLKPEVHRPDGPGQVRSRHCRERQQLLQLPQPPQVKWELDNLDKGQDEVDLTCQARSLSFAIRSLRLTLLFGLLCCPKALARRLFVRKLEYCSDQSILLLQHLELEYDDADRSLSFDIVAQAFNDTVEAVVQVEATAYGVKLLDRDLDRCEMTESACTASYNFDGQATYTFRDENVARIPRMAFYVPDLEVSFRVTFRDRSDDSLVACMCASALPAWSFDRSTSRQGEFSNGISMQQKKA